MEKRNMDFLFSSNVFKQGWEFERTPPKVLCKATQYSDMMQSSHCNAVRAAFSRTAIL